MHFHAYYLTIYSMSCARIRNRPVRFLDPQVKLILELRGEIKRLRDENDQLRISMLNGAPGRLKTASLTSYCPSSLP